MSDATPAATSVPTWRIDRFELIFFNARHRRWQHFAEDPRGTNEEQASEGESPNRRQVRRFLRTFRDFLSGISRATNGFHWWTPDNAGHSKIHLARPTDDRFPDWRDHWDGYLSYLIATARFEGLSDRVRNELGVFRRGDRSPLVEQLGVNGHETFPVSRATALSILSLLPILDSWDVWGKFKTDLRHSCSDGTQHGLFLPFSISEFRFDDEDRSGPSGEILGRRVMLHARWRDLFSPDAEYTSIGPCDFFEWCLTPKNERGERYLYRCYAHFTDHIRRELSADAPSGDGTAAPTNNERRDFVVAYPIQVAGRLHYLQIAITTANTDVTVEDLQKAWGPVHRILWQQKYVEELQFELASTSLWSFQRAALDTASKRHDNLMQTSTGRDRQPISLSLSERANVLAEHLYHVLPLRKLTVQDTTWAYADYDDFERLPGLVLGSKWRGAKVDDNTSSTRQDRTATFAFTVDGLGEVSCDVPRFNDDPIDEPLVKNRAQQTIEQQWDHLTSIGAALEAQARARKQDQKKAARILHRYRDTLEEAARTLVLNHSTSPEVILRWTIPTTCMDDMPDSAPDGYTRDDNSLGRFLAQVHPHAISPADLVQEFRLYLEPGPFELASMLFDSSVVKVACHGHEASEYITAQDVSAVVNELKENGHLGAALGTLAKHLNEATWVQSAMTEPFDRCKTAGNLLTEAWTELVTLVSQNDVKGLKGLLRANGSEKEKQLYRLRQAWERMKFPGTEVSTRIKSFITWDWLSTWVQTYNADCNRRNSSYVLKSDDVGLSEVALEFGLPPLLTGTKQVKLKYSALWLPYVIESEDRFFRKTPNIVVDWPSTAQMARLCVVLSDGRAYEGYRTAQGDAVLHSLDRATAFGGVLDRTPTVSDWTGTATTGLSAAHGRGSVVIIVRHWEAEE